MASLSKIIGTGMIVLGLAGTVGSIKYAYQNKNSLDEFKVASEITKEEHQKYSDKAGYFVLGALSSLSIGLFGLAKRLNNN